MRDEGRTLPERKRRTEVPRVYLLRVTSHESRITSHAPSVTLLDLGFSPKVGDDLLNHLPLHQLL
jgi:hypothetical protein